MIVDVEPTELRVDDCVRVAVEIKSKVHGGHKYHQERTGRVTEVVGEIIRVQFRQCKKPLPVLRGDVRKAWREVRTGTDFDLSTIMATRLAAMRLHSPQMEQEEAVIRILAQTELEPGADEAKFVEYIKKRVADLWDAKPETN